MSYEILFPSGFAQGLDVGSGLPLGLRSGVTPAKRLNLEAPPITFLSSPALNLKSIDFVGSL